MNRLHIWSFLSMLGLCVGCGVKSAPSVSSPAAIPITRIISKSHVCYVDFSEDIQDKGRYGKREVFASDALNAIEKYISNVQNYVPGYRHMHEEIAYNLKLGRFAQGSKIRCREGILEAEPTKKGQ